MEMLTPASQLEFRREWYMAHVHGWERSQPGASHSVGWRETIKANAPEGLDILEALKRTSDLRRFQVETQKWAAKAAMKPIFGGVSGQMVINLIAKRAFDEEGTARLLSWALSLPLNDAEAVGKVNDVAALVKSIKVGSHPAPGSVPFFLSFFWGLVDSSYPVAWPSAVRFIEVSTGLPLPKEPSERYAQFMRLAREIDTFNDRFEIVSRWWDEQTLMMDPGLLVLLSDRCQFGRSFKSEEDIASRELELKANAHALVGVARYIGDAVKKELQEIIRAKIKVISPPVDWKKGRPRSDLWIDWRVGDSRAPGLRLWINHQGIAIGVSPGAGSRKGWLQTASEAVDSFEIPGWEVMASGRSGRGVDRGFVGGLAGSFIYGRWFETHAFSKVDVLSECRRVASECLPVLDTLVGIHRLRPRTAGTVEQGGGQESPKPTGVVGPKPRVVGPKPPDPGAIEELAQDLLVESHVLDEIIGLLDDKGQVILYGPPGTGKTYLARKLAEALSPVDDQRSFVQFHPSMSYEDFFEGYRPIVKDGAMTYRLTPGPLRSIAERAAGDLGHRYVMIIDEINRANLPTVLGELLFLLEYREEQVLPLYQPQQPFELPQNLWFIGTMNTADRSLAHLDAALRRRFHFIPFFPNLGPMEGLLDRWLEANEELGWVGEMVAMVNDELTEALGGPHLQLGASNFMKQGISDDNTGRLEMVWKYTIEPFIEEQLFDQPEETKRFRLDEVRKRYRAQVEPVNEPSPPSE